MTSSIKKNGADMTREELVLLCQQWFEGQPKKSFVPGETFIPAMGKCVDGDDLGHLVDASLDMWLTTGRFAEKFETLLAQKFGVKHASLTVSGSAANLLALTCLTSLKLKEKALKKGDEVLTVAAGFPTTVAPIIQNGLVPVFVDVDASTANVTIEALRAAIGPKTRAIMLAHTLGNPFDLDSVMDLARQHHLYVIEDCCDALGATYAGRPVGSFGDVATASFYPAHHITTGEGGAVLTNNASLKRLIESFRDWGRDCWCPPGKDDTCHNRFGWKHGDLPQGYDHKYVYSHVGYNLKMTDMQAAIGCSQIAKADDFVAKRRQNFDLLTQSFRREGLDEHFILPQATPKADPSWFAYLLTIKPSSRLKRLDLTRSLEERKIGTRLLFAGNITRQPGYKDQEFRVSGTLENTDLLMTNAFAIGVWPGIGDEERAYIVNTLKKLVQER